jgi:hypothetical protein
VALSWDPEHMHVVRESPGDRRFTRQGKGEEADPELEATTRG